MNLDHLKLNREELRILSSLIGQELVAVNYDSLTGEIVLKNNLLSLTPDEIDIPTDSNPYGDIVTLRIEEKKESILIQDNSVLIKCGRVKSIWCLESLVEIENQKPVKESELVENVMLSAGLGWTNNIYNPTAAHPKGIYKALLGLQFETDNGTTFTFYTDAVGFFVLFHNGKSLPEPLLGNCERIEINNLT